jgi:hypothetical protein
VPGRGRAAHSRAAFCRPADPGRLHVKVAPLTRGGCVYGSAGADGSVELDAAFAAMAQYLAERNGLAPPAWTSDAWRSIAPAEWWASTPSIYRDLALEESPRPFRDCGSWITLSGPARA